MQTEVCILRIRRSKVRVHDVSKRNCGDSEGRTDHASSGVGINLAEGSKRVGYCIGSGGHGGVVRWCGSDIGDPAKGRLAAELQIEGAIFEVMPIANEVEELHVPALQKLRLLLSLWKG